jgi:hypothetical protein
MTHSGGKSWGLSPERMGLWEEVARADPTSPALLGLARTYLESGKTAQALNLSRRVLEAHPADLEAAFLTARSMMDLDWREEAGELLALTAGGVRALGGILLGLSELFEQAGDETSAARAREAGRILSSDEPVEISLQDIVPDESGIEDESAGEIAEAEPADAGKPPLTPASRMNPGGPG